MAPTRAEPWLMPEWMEKYRNFILTTGPDSSNVEALYQGSTLVQINAPLALIEMGVQAQVDLLRRLQRAGLLA